MFILVSIPLINDVLDKNASKLPNDFISRDLLIAAINNFRYFVVKDRAYEQMITNTEGWFMLTDQSSMDDYQNTDPFTKEELNNINYRLSSLCKFLTKNEIELILIVPPNKNTIYPEFIPADILKMNNKSRLDQITEIWEESDYCKMLDLRDIFIESKSSSQLYYSTDTHWSDNGVFIAHQALTKMLRQKYPSIQMPMIEDYNLVNHDFRGGLISKNFGQINASEISTFYSSKAEHHYILLSSIGSHGLEVNDSYNSDTDLPSAIVYRDSFLSSWIPFLAQVFREAHYYWTYKIDPNRIIGEHPDIVIYEITERVLINLMLLPDQSQYNINW
jgi:alginate O-acetyltransferase complex protein AlgJ